MCLSSTQNCLCTCFNFGNEKALSESSSSTSTGSSVKDKICNSMSSSESSNNCKAISSALFSSSSHYRCRFNRSIVSLIFGGRRCHHANGTASGESNFFHFPLNLEELLNRQLYIRLVLLVVTVAVFANSLGGDFVHDDIPAICTNGDVQGKTSYYELFNNDFWGMSMSSRQSHKSYRPLTILTFRWNVQATINQATNDSPFKLNQCNLNAFSFHLVNVVLHSLVVQLIFSLVRSYFLGLQSSFLVSLIFATHPIHTEAVSSIVGRADLLAALFAILSLQLYCRAVATVFSPSNCESTCSLTSVQVKQVKEMALFLTASSIFSVLALLSKETGITVLPVCVIYYFSKKTLYSCSSSPGGCTCAFPPSTSSCNNCNNCNNSSNLSKSINNNNNNNSININNNYNYDNHIHMNVHCTSCRKGECPSLVNRTVILRNKFNSYFLTHGPLIMPLMTMIACIWWRMSMLHGSLPFFSDQDNPSAFTQSPITRFLTLWYLAAFNAHLIIFPSNLSYDWQMGSIQLVTSPFDVRNYLSLVLVSIVAAIIYKIRLTIKNVLRMTLVQFGCKHLPHGGKLIIGDFDQERENVSLLMALAITIVTFIPASNLLVTVGFVIAERILYLPSLGIGLIIVIGWKKLLRCTPSRVHNWLACLFYLVIFVFAVKTVQRNRVWLNRQSLFESGLMSTPSNAKVHYNYANLQKDLGNGDLAERHYRIALRLWPRHESSLNNLATLISDRSPLQAEEYFRQVLQINPFHPKAHFNLANIYSKRGLKGKAINLLMRTIQVDGNFAEAYSMLASLCTLSSAPRKGKNFFPSPSSSPWSSSPPLASSFSFSSFSLSNASDSIASAGCPADIGKLHLKALQLSPYNGDIINDYGAFLHMTGKKESAVIQYTKALQVNPGHKIALSNLNSILRSTDAL